MPVLDLQETMERLLLNIRAGHPVIYIVSHEEDRVMDFLIRVLRVLRLFNSKKQLLRWDAGDYFQKLVEKSPHALSPSVDWRSTRDWQHIEGGRWEREGKLEWRPINQSDAVTTLNNFRVQDWRSQPEIGDSVLVMRDVHGSLTADPLGRTLVRPLRNAAAALRQYYDQQRDLHHNVPKVQSDHFYHSTSAGPRPFPYKTIVIVAPTKAGLSPELERDMIVLDFPLPEQDELMAALNRLMDGIRPILSIESPSADEFEKVAGTASRDEQSSSLKMADIEIYRSRLKDLIAGGGRGLTLDAFKHGISGYAVRGEDISSRHVNDILNLKGSFISNEALQYTPNVEVHLGGLKRVRDWLAARRDPACHEAVRSQYRLPPLSGVMLCGASGSGKSMLAKLIAAEFKVALLRLDVGALFGSYIGESEQRTRDALRLAEVLAPIVLWLDECEKAFSGLNNGGDNGVSARVFGTFLTWLAEKKDSVFVVATANDFRDLFERYPEFSRKGRFDEIFWIDLPDQAARRDIFHIYLSKGLENNSVLKITDDDVAGVETILDVQLGPITGGNIGKLAELLSSDVQSGGMTGAEIEYFVKDLMYELYHRDQSSATDVIDAPSSDLILRTLEAAKQRALYRVGGELRPKYDAMVLEARNKGWPFVS